MKLNREVLASLALALMLFVPCAIAQTQTVNAKPGDAKPGDAKPLPESYQTFYLTNLTQQNELIDVSTDLRNMLPKAKLYPIPFQNAISMQGTSEEIQLAQKIIAELDQPRKIYRLNYTITETDGGKPAGARHYSLIEASGQKSVLKQGSKVPIVTGSSDADSSKSNTQVQYLDVGLLIEATVDGKQNGLRLTTQLVQSSLAEEKSGVGAQDPIIHQTSLNAISILTPGKPLVLGSLDISGTTRKQEIEVVLEVVGRP